MERINSDLFGYLEQLQRALCDPALEEFDSGTPSQEAKRAAARVAIALGFCRLFGLDPGEHDGTLPVPEALGAAEALLEDVAVLKQFVQELPRRWDEAMESIEAEGLCADVLEGRMRIWAGEVALSEAALSAMDDGDPRASQLNRDLDNLAKEVDALDKLIQHEEIMFLLSTLVGTALLENWRSMLVEPYSLALPYWLDGTLEEYDRRSQEIVAASSAQFCRPSVRRVAPSRRAIEILRQLRTLAVAADAGTEFAPLILLRWQSPDGKYLAELPLPRQPIAGQDVVLEMTQAETRTPAQDLANSPVNLAGIEGILDENARMVIPFQPLKEAAERQPELTLTVAGETWQGLPPVE